MPKELIKQGYKIYGIADYRYIYNWIWSSREKGLQDMFNYLALTPTSSLIYHLILSLPCQNLTIYLNNYFTSIALFSELRACGFGAVRTTQTHTSFPTDLIEIKDRFSTKLPWNTLLAAVIKDILCLAWQDNNIILALSTIYTIDKVEDFREKVRRRPAKKLTNGRIVRQVFGDNYAKNLQIPCFINDYNQYMGGVDLANQFREAYTSHRPTFRTWWPLFY